jgi:hypothetical protein
MQLVRFGTGSFRCGPRNNGSRVGSVHCGLMNKALLLGSGELWVCRGTRKTKAR